MKKLATTTLGILLAFAATVSAQVPEMMNYQGRVTIGGTNFDGTGWFKFALVDGAGATTYWSTDTNVVVSVSKGSYAVLLGDAGLTPIPAAIFTNADVRLRVWFGDATNTVQQLSPDQRIASVGYAMMAGNVADGAITSNKFATGLATPANTASAVVMRDASGNFSANSALFTGGIGLQQGAGGDEIWSATVTNVTDGEGHVLTNFLMFSTSQGLGIGFTPNGDFHATGEISAEGSVNASGWVSADAGIWSDGPISTASNIHANAEIGSDTKLSSGGDIYAVNDIYAGHNIDAGNDISCSVLYEWSDRNRKEKFAPIDTQEILKGVVSLPISYWNFKGDEAARHIGPMAQDFRAAFKVGADDKYIGSVDKGGVALAAIQGLYQELQEQKKRNDALEKRLAELEKLLAAHGGKRP